MAQVYEPYDLTQRALKSMSLDDKLPKFNENEIDDASIMQALADKDGTAALPGILGVCIPAGRVPAFISAFKAALEHRKQETARERKQEQRRAAAEKGAAAAFLQGKTDIVSAAGQGLLDVIAARAATGEDVNQLIGGSTPLTNAAANGQREACELLLQLKADINKMGYNNRTPLQWAVDRNHTSTADFLRQRGGR